MTHISIKYLYSLYYNYNFQLKLYNVILSPWEGEHNGSADSEFPYLMILNTSAALSVSRLRNLLKLVMKRMKKYFLYLLLLSLIGKTSEER